MSQPTPVRDIVNGAGLLEKGASSASEIFVE